MAVDALKVQQRTWETALFNCEQNNYEKALDLFEDISDSPKVCFNMALLHFHLGDLEESLHRLSTAITLDPMLAVAYFERGVCNFELGRMTEALDDFRDAAFRLRGAREIDYSGQGLKYTLYLAEILHNKGLVLLSIGRQSDGLSCLGQAVLKKSIPAHHRIHEALAYPDKEHALFIVSYQSLFAPTDSNLKLLKGLGDDLAAPLTKPSFRRLYTDSNFKQPRQLSTTSLNVDFYKALPSPPASKRGSVISIFTADSQTSYESETYLPSVQSALHSRLPSTSATASSSSSRVELEARMGHDYISHTTEISTIPCAGTRISSGALEGLMGFRLVVQLPASASSKHQRRKSSSSSSTSVGNRSSATSHHRWTSPAVVTNFILDTGINASLIPPEALRTLKYGGNITPGTHVPLTVQGVETRCIVGHEGEAGRLNGRFLTDGSLTFHFDSRLDAPVLYVADELSHRAFIPRTVKPHAKRMSLRDSISSLLRTGAYKGVDT